MFVLQTTEISEKRVDEIQLTKLNSYYKQLQNVGNPDRKEVKVMPQIILYEWKIIFSGSWKSSSQNAIPCLDLAIV